MLCSIFISYFLSIINLTLTLICIHTELPDRSGAALLLPLSKDSRTKEENHKLLNGNSGDPTDWVLKMAFSTLFFTYLIVIFVPRYLFLWFWHCLLLCLYRGWGLKWMASFKKTVTQYMLTQQWMVYRRRKLLREQLSSSILWFQGVEDLMT